MKRRVAIFITAIFMALGMALLFTACGDTVEKSDYSVTVLTPDEEPVSGATVSWMNGSSVAGSAKTGSDGKASAELPLGTYGIELADYGDGYEYDAISVGSSMRNITLTLSVKRVVYLVTVTDKDGAAAEGVTVSWSDDSAVAGTAKTNASGKAECELDYGSYSVTLSDLPEGNLYDGAQTVGGSNPTLSFTLHGGASVQYKVTVQSEGGLLFADQTVQIFSGETRVASGSTDENGVFTFTAKPDDYTVRTARLQEGYSFEPVTLTEDTHEVVLKLHSEIITDTPASDLVYLMGDIFHNYTFTTPYALNGEIWSKTVAEILQEKEVLILNNWGTNCTYCVKEMPMMEEIYQKYQDQIEIVAVSNYMGGDSNSAIVNYHAQNGYTFPMMRDVNGFATKFGITGWPTTIVIDRYGAVARIEVGAITSTDAWEYLVNKYIGDDYVQTFIPGTNVSEPDDDYNKPDVELPEDHYENIANKLNDTSTFPKGASITWFGEEEWEYAWPFLIGPVEGVSQDGEDVLYATNSGKAGTMAIIYATVNVEAGKALTFDYYADTEAADFFYVVWDGRIILKLSGNSKGWQTCYLFSEITSGEHALSITYVKDSSGDVGKDNVYLRNVRFVDVSEITESTDMLRSAAYGEIAEGATVFPHYADVYLADDGYYHVNLAGLENSHLAGNDNSPLLLANLLNVTNFVNDYSLAQLLLAQDESGEYFYSCTFEVNGVKRDYRDDLVKYMTAAVSSEIEDCVPVDAYLHDLLVGFAKSVSTTTSSTHDNEWLELCYFYSHYGDGDPVGNPIMGLMEKTAIIVDEGTYTADLTRNMYPYPSLIYTFTPKASAVYKFESLIPAKDAAMQAAQIWLYDDKTIDGGLAYCGSDHITLDGVNEHNFELFYYMQAGHKYYFRVSFQMAGSGILDFKVTNVGQSVTEFTTCSADSYNMVLDEEGNITDQIVLSGAIDYVLGDDGYYRAVNPDGTTGDYIYMDVTRVSSGALLGGLPLDKLVDKYVRDPATFEDLEYKYFDFRYGIAYFREVDANGDEIVNYDPEYDLTQSGDKYKDYTDIMKAYIDAAPTEGEYAGLIKVDQDLVDIISLYFEVRVNAIWDDVMEEALENEWLRLCWYNRTHNEANP